MIIKYGHHGVERDVFPMVPYRSRGGIGWPALAGSRNLAGDAIPMVTQRLYFLMIAVSGLSGLSSDEIASP
jgi:hypothetical protein